MTPTSRVAAWRSLPGRGLDAVAGRVLGLPPATTDYTVHRAIRVPTRDGVSLAADHYEPASGNRGTLLIRGPYGRHVPLALPFARLFAARGYHALFVSSRGTFGSQGEFWPMRTEAADGQDVVAWLRGQPWFNGKLATLGGSYLGHTQWALLTDPPPELVTSVVSVGPHDFSRHAWGTGAFKLDFLGWSAMVAAQEDTGPVRGAVRMATGNRRVAAALDDLPLVDAGRRLLGDRAPWYQEWVTRPDLSDPFWAPTQHGAALDRVTTPVLLISGWQDLFLEQTVQQYRRLRARGVEVAMTIGPWGHYDTSAGGLRVTTRETYDWLEHQLTGAAYRRRSPVHVFVTGSGGWTDLPDWPPRTSPYELFPQPDGTLTLQPPGEPGDCSFRYDPADPTPTVGGPLLARRCVVEDSALARRPDVLSFTGAPLDVDLEVCGAPLVRLVHRTDNPYADVFVRVSEVDPKGRSHNVTEGYLRLDPARQGDEVALELRDVAHRFAAGHRIRLLVAGGSHPHYARNLGTDEPAGRGSAMRPSTHTVGLDRSGGSCLRLPRVG